MAKNQVKSDIPLAKGWTGVTEKLRAMEVGEHVDFPLGQNVSTMCSGMGKKSGKKFVSRTIQEGGKEFIRVWRKW